MLMLVIYVTAPHQVRRVGGCAQFCYVFVFAPPKRGVALFSQPFANTGGGNMNIPNVDVMNQVTNVTNEPHSHVVVWMNETFFRIPPGLPSG